MGSYDYGPIDAYEITWMLGHVETIEAHQVTHKSRVNRLARLGDGEFAQETEGERIVFHGQIDGRWCLVLDASVDDIRTVRRITDGEHLAGGL